MGHLREVENYLKRLFNEKQYSHICASYTFSYIKKKSSKVVSVHVFFHIILWTIFRGPALKEAVIPSLHTYTLFFF
jgi:hypothetical protein